MPTTCDKRLRRKPQLNCSSRAMFCVISLQVATFSAVQLWVLFRTILFGCAVLPFAECFIRWTVMLHLWRLLCLCKVLSFAKWCSLNSVIDDTSHEPENLQIWSITVYRMLHRAFGEQWYFASADYCVDVKHHRSPNAAQSIRQTVILCIWRLCFRCEESQFAMMSCWPFLLLLSCK